MTAAEKRVEELLDRWMASVELHARYLKLDDAAYARAEAWPPHQRPTKWIIDVARQRLLELRAQSTQRQDAGDPAFAEALELMSFLTSLLGTEHIERYIPLATGKAARPPSDTDTVEQTRPRAAKARDAGDATTARNRRPPAPPKQPAAPKPAAATPRPSPSGPAREPTRPASVAHAKTDQVIADAVRMLEWGREWPALAGLIARMADRPSETEVWKILRSHRTAILTKARRPAD
jgi:hypothetical protein